MIFASVFPQPDSNTFFQLLCGLAMLFGAILLGHKVWRVFFPNKSREDEPVTRREFEEFKNTFTARSNSFSEKVFNKLSSVSEDIAALKSVQEARQDAFNSTLANILRNNEKNLDRLVERVSAVEKQLSEKNK